MEPFEFEIVSRNLAVFLNIFGTFYLSVVIFFVYVFFLSVSSHDSASSLPWIQSGSSTPTGPPAVTSSAIEVGTIEVIRTQEINPGEYVLRTLFSEFTILAEKKIDRLMKESFVSSNINFTAIFIRYAFYIRKEFL